MIARPSLLPLACRLALLALFALVLAPPSVRATSTLPTGFSDELIVTGLNYSVEMARLPDGRLLVSQKNDGQVRLVIGNTLVPAPVLTLDSVRVTSESGLLGIAPDPGWPARPYIYLHYNWSGGPYIRLVRYTVTGDLDGTGNGLLVADPASRYIILHDLPDQSQFHNGGMLRFGPDGMLYEVLGEDLVHCDSPKPEAMRGKLLRLDVQNLPAGPGGPPPLALITPADNPFVGHPDPRARLVWARGLRNPWTFHFDPPTGDIYIADVGANRWEEVDVIDGPGLNFGWPSYEGPATTGLFCPSPDSAGSIRPIYAYDRTAFLHGAAICGSGVYRRPATGAGRFPAEYEGNYFFTDAGEKFLRRIVAGPGGWQLADSVAGQPTAENWGQFSNIVTDFMQLPDGSMLYLVYSTDYNPFTGQIHRISYDNTLAVPPAGPSPLQLEQPYPIPARGRVTIAFSLTAAGDVRLDVLDLAGRRVRTLIAGERRNPGRDQATWDGLDNDGRKMAAGMYLVRLSAGGAHAERRMILTP